MELAGLLSRKIGEDIHLAHPCTIWDFLENGTSLVRRCHKSKGKGYELGISEKSDMNSIQFFTFQVCNMLRRSADCVRGR